MVVEATPLALDTRKLMLVMYELMCIGNEALTTLIYINGAGCKAIKRRDVAKQRCVSGA